MESSRLEFRRRLNVATTSVVITVRNALSDDRPTLGRLVLSTAATGRSVRI